MDGCQNPLPEGVSAGGPPVDADGVVRKYPLRVGAATRLADLAEEYAFFTPAVLYLHGGFTDAPLADLLAARPAVRFFFRKFARPLFRGLKAPSNGNPDWNFALWAVERAHWPAVADWLVSLTFTYAQTREVAGVGQQELTIADPLAADRMGVYAPPPPVVVGAFGVNGSRGVAYLAAGDGTVLRPPRLAFGPPSAEMAAFGKALYGGDDPVAARLSTREGRS